MLCPTGAHTDTSTQTHAKVAREPRESRRREEAGDPEGLWGGGGIHIYRAFLAFVPRPNAVTTLG